MQKNEKNTNSEIVFIFFTEKVKEDLVELNACEIILNILEKFENVAMDEEIRLIVKYGSDLIVCITTGGKFDIKLSL